MSERTERTRHEYTEPGGGRVRTTSITDKPAPRREPPRRPDVSESWEKDE